MPQVKVCFSPLLFPLYDTKNSNVVVIDIFRATTAICTAFHYGIKSVIPVATIEEAKVYENNPNFLVAAERDGKVYEGFSLGNSPYHYMDRKKLENKILVITTTNGTQAINVAKKNAKNIYVGAFSNQTALINQLVKDQEDVVLLCSGWKNRFNLEDTLFAGAIVESLLGNQFTYSKDNDEALAALQLFRSAKANMFDYLALSSHRQRLEHLNLTKDILYCLTVNTTNSLPMLKNDSELVDMNQMSC